MKDIWFISDTHWFHGNCLKFLKKDGTRMRSEFQSCKEMDDEMIARWNRTVKPQDKVYHLGDVAFGSTAWLKRLMNSLHGHKRLVVGNHDNIKALAPFFEKVMLWRIFTEYNFIATHLPIREDQLRAKCQFNVHGHLHDKPSPSPNHICVCVEQINYTPIHLDEIRKEIANRS